MEVVGPLQIAKTHYILRIYLYAHEANKKSYALVLKPSLAFIANKKYRTLTPTETMLSNQASSLRVEVLKIVHGYE